MANLPRSFLLNTTPAGRAIDDRGQLTFVNSIPFSAIRRFYMVENFELDTVRAFHGHLNETKFAFIVSGSALFVLIGLRKTDGGNVELSDNISRGVLSCRVPEYLIIPSGSANGFRSLEPDTKIIFFSTSTTEESQKDDYRFPWDTAGKEIWRAQSR